MKIKIELIMKLKMRMQTKAKEKMINYQKKKLILKIIYVQKKIGKYLEEQKEKYLKIYKDNEVLNNNYFLKTPFDLNFHCSRNSRLAILKEYSDKLKNYFNNFNGNYNKNFGFVVLKNIAYFYLNDTDEQEKVLLYDCSRIKKIDYGTTDKISDSLSFTSYSPSNKSNRNEDTEIKCNLFCGKESEKNWVDFFDICFKLEHLPSIFFSVKINEPKNNISNIIQNNYYSNNNNSCYYFPIGNFNINSNYYAYRNNNNFNNFIYYTYIPLNFENTFFYNNNLNNINNKDDSKNKDKKKTISIPKDQKTNDNTIEFEKYINNLFKIYIETDCARFNNKNENLSYTNFDKPFFEYEPFQIKKSIKSLNKVI